MAGSDVTERRKARGLSRRLVEGPDCFEADGWKLWKVSKVANNGKV